jgi:hypothetical protein
MASCGYSISGVTNADHRDSMGGDDNPNTNSKLKEIDTMLVKITEINDAKLGTFDAKQIEGVRIDSGEPWGKKFFANNRKLADELAEFGVGDNVNVKMVQEGKHWNIAAFTEVSEAMIEKVKAGGGGYKGGDAAAKPAGGGYKASAGGGKAKGGDNMSKAEWAAKDLATKTSIARAVALKCAIDFVGGKAKMTEGKLVESAKAFMPFLMDEKFDESPSVGGDDGLEPPVV